MSGSMEVLRPCWAVATSGVPVREQLFNASICHHSPFNLFQHGDLSRGFGRHSDMSSLEVAAPILIPTNDGHKHRKGSHGDVVFLTNRGEVWCALNTPFHFHVKFLLIVHISIPGYIILPRHARTRCRLELANPDRGHVVEPPIPIWINRIYCGPHT